MASADQILDRAESDRRHRPDCRDVSGGFSGLSRAGQHRYARVRDHAGGKNLSLVYRLSRFYDRVEEGSIAVRRLLKVFNEESEIRSRPDGLKPKTIAGQIEFQAVDYLYPGSRIKALEGVSLKISSGCVTALVGPSGGGKTTVARMIYRHYDPTTGRIMLDGHDLKDYDLNGFRRFIAIVPQEVEIFNDSVKYNICYARPDASRREIEAAARIANAEEFILKLPKKYATEVGERGVKLLGRPAAARRHCPGCPGQSSDPYF